MKAKYNSVIFGKAKVKFVKEIIKTFTNLWFKKKLYEAEKYKFQNM